MGFTHTNNPTNVINDKTPKNLTVMHIPLEELLGSRTSWTNENYIFEARPNACHVGNCLVLFGINNKTNHKRHKEASLDLGGSSRRSINY